MPRSSPAGAAVVVSKGHSHYRLMMTAEQREKFLQAIVNGVGIDTAATLVRLRPRTVRDWLKEGEKKADDILDPTSKAAQCVKFSQDYLQAKAAGITSHALNVNQHASGERRNGAPGESRFMLKVMNPDRFSDQYQVNQAAQQQVMRLIKYLSEMVSSECWEELAQVLATVPGLSLKDAMESGTTGEL